MTDAKSVTPTGRASAGNEFRLHPLSVLFNLRGELRSLMFPAIAVLIAGRKLERGYLAQLVGLLVIALIGATARYFSQRMRFDETEFVIKSGIFKRNERRIPYARIQSVDSTRNALQQALGVAEIVIRTAGSAEPEAKLTVLSVHAVADFRQRIFGAQSVIAAPGALVVDSGVTVAPTHREEVLRLSTRGPSALQTRRLSYPVRPHHRRPAA